MKKVDSYQAKNTNDMSDTTTLSPTTAEGGLNFYESKSTTAMDFRIYEDSNSFPSSRERKKQISTDRS
jgi:hypothetical protein